MAPGLLLSGPKRGTVAEPERRESERFPLVLAVQFLDAESVFDYTENLSGAGLFVRTAREFSIGDRVPLVISFPELPDPVEVVVEVVRTRQALEDVPAGVAVRVPENLPEHRALLEKASQVLSEKKSPADALRVLVVEDNALVAALYEDALRRIAEEPQIPLTVETVADGGLALQRLLRKPSIDVVLTDVFMPVSGITLLECMRADPSLAGTPAVVISSGDNAVREEVARLGAAAFLPKPVNYSEFALTVGRVLATVRGASGKSRVGTRCSGS